MSETFTVYGRGNVLSSGSIYPPVKLDPRYQYSLGLVGLYTCNSVRNIFEGNNKFYYNNKEITIESGSYEVDEISAYLKSKINDKNSVFKLKPNNNTLKCEIESSFTIDFTKPGNIGGMLGFTNRILQPNIKHVSDKEVEIIRTSNIFVDTNITRGAYRNNTECHSIFEFGLSVEPGYMLEKEPSHIIYLPISVSEFDNITLRLVDHNGELVDFGPDTHTSVRLELKRQPWD